MTDREDDLKIGIKSTAILFGDADRLIIGSLQGLTLLLLALAGSRFELGLYFYLGRRWRRPASSGKPGRPATATRRPASAPSCTTTGLAWRSSSARSPTTRCVERRAGRRPSSPCRLGDVPGAHLAVTVLVARLLVLDEGIKGLAVVGPLLGAVLASDQAPVALACAPWALPAAASSSRTARNRRIALRCPCRRYRASCPCHRPARRPSRWPAPPFSWASAANAGRASARPAPGGFCSSRLSPVLQVERSPPAGTAPEPVEHSPAAGSRRKLRRCVTYLTQFVI